MVNKKEGTTHKTREVFEKLCGKKLSEKELFEAKNNLVGFFNLLIEIDQQDKRKEIVE